MTHYSDDSEMVRVDFWKQSGKWYTTEAVKWTGRYKGVLIHDEFEKSLRDHLGGKDQRHDEMRATCLEPYYEHAHPISIQVASIWEREA